MFDIEQFEDASHQNGIRYWLAHDYMRALGYESWPSFKTVIQRAQASCLHLGIETEDTFMPCLLADGTRSYKLTRFACYLIAMQADVKKPEVAAAQVALARLAEALLAEKLAESGIPRLEERGRLTDAEKQLAGVARQPGVATGEYGIFKDAGYRGMYNMPLQDLKRYKQLPEGKTLYDYMGLTELAANTFRITQTSERMKRLGTHGLQQAKNTAHEVGREVRYVMLRSSGTAPEDLALEGDIRQVRKQIKTANREMKKLDTPPKKKR